MTPGQCCCAGGTRPPFCCKPGRSQFPIDEVASVVRERLVAYVASAVGEKPFAYEVSTLAGLWKPCGRCPTLSRRAAAEADGLCEACHAASSGEPKPVVCCNSRHGHVCTLDAGHEGDHCSAGLSGSVYAMWSNDARPGPEPPAYHRLCPRCGEDVNVFEHAIGVGFNCRVCHADFSPAQMRAALVAARRQKVAAVGPTADNFYAAVRAAERCAR